MADKSKIQRTESTWNVVTGCTKISDGCVNCYITGTPPFRMAGRKFDGPGIGASTGVTLHPDRLEMPLRWKQPRMVFVNSLADLFHEDVPTEYIAQVFAVMALASRHTFQVLTKRHARLRALLNSRHFHLAVLARTLHLQDDNHLPPWNPATRTLTKWPLPNVHVGVSVETQQWADIRIPALLDTLAAVRWISAEPLLGPVQLRSEWVGDGPSLSWAVVGGESGVGARPMDLAWARSLVRQCQLTKTPAFVKQLGSVYAKDLFVGGRSLYAQGDRKGGDWTHWPTDLRVREHPLTDG
ncbi:DUF5131 family protein [Streptosporangium jomthongense]|uniref:DUF5131 family protein n=1 Tax=Streptosporangium jomthongense TaxID=1193683 RepID=A0ABV8FDG0_9ACTN